MGGNDLSFWTALVSYIAIVVGCGLTATGLMLLILGMVLRWAL